MQIADHFRTQIKSGKLADNAKLPPVAELARSWHVASATAAKALTQLRTEGYVRTTNQGTFVAVNQQQTTPKHSVSVAGVVIDDQNRVLVIRREDNGHWEAPGGVLELDESFEEGVRREVLEETGVHVRVDRLTGVYKNLTHGIVALVFRCTTQYGEPHPTSEAREVRWMTRDEVRDAMNPAFAIRVLDAFDTDTHSRAHDGVNLVAVQNGRPQP